MPMISNSYGKEPLRVEDCRFVLPSAAVHERYIISFPYFFAAIALHAGASAFSLSSSLRLRERTSIYEHRSTKSKEYME